MIIPAVWQLWGFEARKRARRSAVLGANELNKITITPDAYSSGNLPLSNILFRIKAIKLRKIVVK